MKTAWPRRVLGVAVPVLLCAIRPPPTAAADQSPLTNDWLRTGWICSSTWPIMVVGADRMANQDVMKWTEAVASKVEETLRRPLPRDFWTLRIAVRTGAAAEQAGAADEGSAPEGGNLRLTFDYERADVKACRERLCRQFLNAYVAVSRATSEAGTKVVAGEPVPEWLCRGVANALTSAERAASVERIVEAWERGALPTVAAILGAGSVPDSGASPGVSDDVVLLGWLVSQASRKELFDSLFRRLSAGQQADLSWLCAHTANCRTPADVEEAWDHWVFRQKRVVFDPARPSALGISLLRAELLLYAEDCGIKDSASRFAPIALPELIARRREAWVARLCTTKAIQLELLKGGRGPDLGECVDRYVRFLRATPTFASDDMLKRLLEEANSGLALLDSRLSAGTEVGVRQDRGAATEGP